MEFPQILALPLASDMPRIVRRQSRPSRRVLPERKRRETDRFFRQMVAGMRNGVVGSM